MTAATRHSISADAASPNGAVNSVDFFVNSNLLETVTTAPYTLVWSNPPVGLHQLTARVTDATGAQAVSRSVAVTINPLRSSRLMSAIFGTTARTISSLFRTAR